MPTNIRDLGVEPEKIDEMAENALTLDARCGDQGAWENRR